MEEGELLNLLFQSMEDCCFLNHIRTDDPYGGYSETWSEGASFKAAIAKNNSIEAVIAEKQGISETFTVVTMKTTVLDYHDVFKRKRDNAIFRVTGTTKDNESHPHSTVEISKTTAERWELPS